MKKITLICGILLFVALSIYNINSASVHNTLPFSISNILPIANADDENSGSWIRNQVVVMQIINDYTTSLGCPQGEIKNCLVTKTTTTVTCLPGGSKACSSGSSSYNYTQCGDCF